MNPVVATAAALLLSAPVLAATNGNDTTAVAASADPTGDAANGEAAFGGQCVTCHVVVSPDGETLAGSRGRQGPNLYGVAGGPVSAVGNFKYGKPMIAAGEAGAVWTEENFVAYVQDPADWLRTTLGDKKARSRMGWKVRDTKEAADLYAYLHSLAPYEAE